MVNKINYSSNVDSYAFSSKLIMPTKKFIRHSPIFITSAYHCIVSRARVSLDKSCIEAPLGLKKYTRLAFICNIFCESQLECLIEHFVVSC